MDYTDEQLKRVLAKLLPDKLIYISNREPHDRLHWLEDSWVCTNVLELEMLHACHLAEKTLVIHDADVNTPIQEANWEFVYGNNLMRLTNRSNPYHATWQQRTIALAQTKGIPIE